MIHLYTGNGKGKTTAAIGLCIRTVGWDRQVCFAQFMKGNDTGELHVLQSLPEVTILRSEKNFGFYSSMSDSDKEELTEIHNCILDRILELVESGNCQLVILDEITYPVNWGLLDMEKLKQLLAFGKQGADRETEIVLTGRSAQDLLVDMADYITDMVCVRHPYEKGTRARKGIEF
ncbi:MAG: cob(I)yrinic acid a,c-diamide adenosyltransferase [Lachnospiraceae bacterium]|nr:cob(I)yrinic acid a,c-diamide adenosyltransferase [Lachnospiraceae bacterium]